MRVLFTHSYFLRFDPKQWELMQPYAPLGTLYAAACLREQGHEVMLHDVMFENTALSIKPKIESFIPDIVVVYDDGFNYLTKMCLTNMREAALQMSRIAKEYGCTVIVSSSDATDHSDTYLQVADFIIVGEGEQTLTELVIAISAGTTDFKSINGLIYLQQDKLTRTLPRKVLHDLDSLPHPAWDLADMAAYKAAWRKSTGYFSINMSTTRGCPYKCNWCAKPIYGNRYNARTPEDVVYELQILHQVYGFDHVWFCDDIFGLKPGWVKRFAALIAAANITFRYKIQSRADLLLEESQVIPLATSGCETVWIGAESGSQKILDAMDKGITVLQIQDATAALKKQGIMVAFFLQFGYPGEEMTDIQMTLDMLARLIPGEIGISVSYPLPGTRFYDRVKEQLQQKANWTDSNDLALMFTNTYEPSFYKRLHEYVHDYYRVIKAKADIKAQLQKGIDSQLISKLIRLPYYHFKEMRSKQLVQYTTRS